MKIGFGRPHRNSRQPGRRNCQKISGGLSGRYSLFPWVHSDHFCYFLSVRKKCILVGDIAAVMVTVRVLMSYLDEFFNEKLAGIVEAYPGLKNLHEVLEMTSGKVEACTPEFQKIELKDVRVYLILNSN